MRTGQSESEVAVICPLRCQMAHPDHEVDHHQTDIEFEGFALGQDALDRAERHQLEARDLAVMVVRHEIFRQLEVIDEQRVVAEVTER